LASDKGPGNDDDRFELVEIPTMQELFDIFRGQPLGWRYRGQRLASWPLRTALERVSLQGFYVPQAEQFMLIKFRAISHQYRDEIGDLSGLLEVLALMQHHGAPTRLLDWTRSPFVATFFAFNDVLAEDKTCAVWAIRPAALAGENKKILESQFSGTYDFGLKDDKVLGDLFYREQVSLVDCVEPRRLNRRMVAQQGTFVCPGDTRIGFMDNLKAYPTSVAKKALVKLVLPASLRTEVLAELKKMNITEATLFPGLDGFCRSIRNEAELLADTGHLLDIVEQNLRETGSPYGQPQNRST
jgi:hypothetical protein